MQRAPMCDRIWLLYLQGRLSPAQLLALCQLQKKATNATVATVATVATPKNGAQPHTPPHLAVP